MERVLPKRQTDKSIKINRSNQSKRLEDHKNGNDTTLIAALGSRTGVQFRLRKITIYRRKLRSANNRMSFAPQRQKDKTMKMKATQRYLLHWVDELAFNFVYAGLPQTTEIESPVAKATERVTQQRQTDKTIKWKPHNANC